jgi:hypothetical protein
VWCCVVWWWLGGGSGGGGAAAAVVWSWRGGGDGPAAPLLGKRIPRRRPRQFILTGHDNLALVETLRRRLGGRACRLENAGAGDAG